MLTLSSKSPKACCSWPHEYQHEYQHGQVLDPELTMSSMLYTGEAPYQPEPQPPIMAALISGADLDPIVHH